MTIHNPRGFIGAPRMEGEGIEALSAVFASYHNEAKAMASDIKDLRKHLDEMSGNIAALKVGGAGGGGTGGSAKAAIQAMGQFMRTGIAPRAEHSTDSDPDGGYLTKPEMDSSIGQFLETVSPMRRLARVKPTRSGVFEIPFNKGQAASGWVTERQSRPETDTPDFALLSYPAMEVYAMPRATQTMLDDSLFDFEDFMNNEILKEFARQEGTAFVTGDGVNKPRGFLSYTNVSTSDATRDFGKIQYFPSGVASALSDSSNNGVDALLTMVYGLKAPYRQGAAWVMNSTTGGVVRKLQDANKQYYWQPPIQAGAPTFLLGYPVYFAEHMPDIGANSFPIAFADWKSAYVITDRLGIRLLRDPYTAKPYVNFYATKRVGGGMVDSKAIKLLKIATT